ncbi:hypothetical protein SEA_SORORFAGO_76 [Mycobacterium phage SororFago]|nr:hypothetical protein SEA_SORORFAGO_76 [Mycobacterium phage SororFago]
MPLSKIGRLFPDVSHSEPITIAHVQGFLWAQKCDFWKPEIPEDPCTVLLVYKSIQVKDTKEIYRPVAQAILEAECQDVLYETIHKNEEMLRGKAQVTLMRLSAANHKRWYDRARVEQIINDGVFLHNKEAA